MSVNIPFNTYKIYKTNLNKDDKYLLPKKDVPILCFCHSEEADHTEFLRKVMEAGKVEESQYEVILLEEGQKVSFGESRRPGTVEYVLCFGIPLSELMISAVSRPYHPVRLAGTTFVTTPALSEIDKSRSEKRELWHLIQNLFIHE